MLAEGQTGLTTSTPGKPMFEEAVVLLVEDREDDVLLINKAFAQACLSNPVHVVRDGDEAIHYINGDAPYADRSKYPLPQLILLDLKLPRVDGFEVLRWLRAQRELDHIIVLVLTVSSDIRDVSRAYKLGANSFMVKPTDFQDVTAMINMLKGYWLLGDKVPGRPPGPSPNPDKP